MLMVVIKIIIGIKYVIDVVILFCFGCDFIVNQELVNVKIVVRIGKMQYGFLLFNCNYKNELVFKVCVCQIVWYNVIKIGN